ncbi:MAG: EpsG family protein, partial [Bacteroidaceae bacterium]|nr:EpsG family protein [Bacteroidaceae bacterium]
MIYFVCIFLLVFLSWRYDKRTSEKPGLAAGNDPDASGNIYFLLYIAFVLLMGLSRALGGDKQVYIENFENIPRLQDGRDTMLMGFVLNLASGIMPLWTFLSILVKSVWPQDFTLFQLIHAAFVNYAVFWFFRKYTNCKYLCLLLYFGYRFFHFNCETMREAIAIALFLFAFPHLQKKNWKVYYALAIPALGFHVSAIMMVILPLIPRIRFTIKSFIRLSVLCLAL